MDLGLFHVVEAAPPFFELEEARARTLRRGEEVLVHDSRKAFGWMAG
jgi:hypothetical protein